ncbi:unnamed protein product [Litomosoides sigmodontis]|uniref:Uncharacterized protein n=1 Tax=Litomosoides sigmodontis TaxID=42156 RepID=A0A3P6TGP0_LITSI|nr:unnamed protein product [Litomosoides sigmodontis]
MLPNQLLRFIAGCAIVNAIFVGIAIKYSDEDISFIILSIKIGVPLLVTEAILLITLYPNETLDILIGNGEFFRETFQTESERSFTDTNIVRAIHSHGDIPGYNLRESNLRRRFSFLTTNS